MTMRLGRSSLVRASTASPSRSTSRWGSRRSAVSSRSASRTSSPLTEGTSHTAAARSTTSSERSRAVTSANLPAYRPVAAATSTLDRMSARNAWGFGLVSRTSGGAVLDSWFPSPALGTVPADPPEPPGLTSLGGTDEARGVTTAVELTEIDLDSAPSGTADAYLRLHLLSHRLVPPHGLNLDGLFAVLPNVVWTDAGPCEVEGFEATRLRLRARLGRPVTVLGVDKFPRMVDYVVPSEVRIADGDRVRLGAHLAPGTTVMHEGFVNFNAGTLGVSMVEGRISAGVVVGDGTDVGGGASIMGTLSGGGTEVISVGERSLLGANSGLGIALGDDCVVEAGLYLTAASKVTLVGVRGADGEDLGGTVVKARELSGASGLLFRRNSLTGGIEAVAREGAGVRLNAALHAN